MSKSVAIKITTTPAVRDHLKALLPLGLYGNTVAEVAERLLCEALREDLKRTRQALFTPKRDSK